MTFRNAFTTLALTAAVCLPAAVYAAPATNLHTPVHAFFGKPHKVSLTLRNDGQQPLTLKAGDQELTLAPGKTAAVKLVEGDKVIAETASPDHALGSVVVVAASNLADATIGIK